MNDGSGASTVFPVHRVVDRTRASRPSTPAAPGPTLLLINGLPSTGKSALARRYVADRPLALCLDIDTVRGLIGSGATRTSAATQLARQLALAMVDTALDRGHDVVVPQFQGRLGFITEMESLARRHSATFTEVVLVEDLPVTVDRLCHGTGSTSDPTRAGPGAELDRLGGAARVLEQLHQRLEVVLTHRPTTHRIVTVPDDLDLTYRRLITCL